MDAKQRILQAVQNGNKMTEIKHPEIRITITEDFNAVMVIGKVTKQLRRLGHYESIEEFMLKATTAESDAEFLNVVKGFVKVKIDG